MMISRIEKVSVRYTDDSGHARLMVVPTNRAAEYALSIKGRGATNIKISKEA